MFDFKVWCEINSCSGCRWCLPAEALWPCCAASLGTAEPPVWARAAGDSDSATEDWTQVSGTGRPVNSTQQWLSKLWWVTESEAATLPAAGLHLVGVHGQQGLVQVNGLELLLHQLVLDTFGVGQLHLLLGVKHVLVLLEHHGIKQLQWIVRWSFICAFAVFYFFILYFYIIVTFLHKLTLFIVMILLAVTASSPTSDGLQSGTLKC